MTEFLSVLVRERVRVRERVGDARRDVERGALGQRALLAREVIEQTRERRTSTYSITSTR